MSLDLKALFDPVSVAVIGATSNLAKWGFSTFLSIIDSYGDRVYPVNTTEDTILKRKAYRRINDIPDEVDLAVFVIPANAIPAVMEDCVEKGVKAALIISAGFAEVGEEGLALQNEVVDIARKGGIRIVGPNCMGFWSASCNLRAFMFPLPVLPGPLGFVSQGGNVGGAVVFSAHERGIGFEKYVSCGCAADIQIEDYIELFAEDPRIKVIMAYIEGLNDGRRFLEKVRRATARKPVIVMKPGKTKAAAGAIVSHSGSLSGSDDIYEAAFKEAGIVRVENAEGLLDVAIGFLTQPLPASRNVGIITPGGSYGVVCADAVASLGLNVVELSRETVEDFNRLFPPRWSHGNPVDPAGDRNFISFLRAPSLLLELGEIGSLIFMGYGSFSTFGADLSFMDIKEVAEPLASLSSSLTGLGQYLQSIMSTAECGDADKLEELLRPFLTMVASFLGSGEKEEVDEFIGKVSSLLASGRITVPVVELEQTTPTPGGGWIPKPMMDSLVDGIEQFLYALVVDWIEEYGKPVITTTFSEIVPRLERGIHHPYPSGERAAQVLAKMVQYREYLEKEGIWRPGVSDPFAFTLLDGRRRAEARAAAG